MHHITIKTDKSVLRVTSISFSPKSVFYQVDFSVAIDLHNVEADIAVFLPFPGYITLGSPQDAALLFGGHGLSGGSEIGEAPVTHLHKTQILTVRCHNVNFSDLRHGKIAFQDLITLPFQVADGEFLALIPYFLFR